jgi:hypothetical protein
VQLHEGGGDDKSSLKPLERHGLVRNIDRFHVARFFSRFLMLGDVRAWGLHVTQRSG